MHQGRADSHFQIAESNEIFCHLVNSFLAWSQLKIEAAILFGQAQRGQRTECKPAVGRIVIARKRALAVKNLTIE